MRVFAVALAALCMSGSAVAQRSAVTRNLTTERIVGLLNIPTVASFVESGTCGPTATETVTAYREPSVAAPQAGMLFARQHPEYGCTLLFTRAGLTVEEELPTEESGYEIPAVAVYERRGRWFRMAIPNGSAWIASSEAADFLPYPQLLTKNLSYLMGDWDGQLRQAPRVTAAIQPLPAEWKGRIARQIGIDVLGVTRVGNEDWIHVRFATERCGDNAVSKLEPVQGWLPGHRPDGRPVAWFYSRGC